MNHHGLVSLLCVAGLSLALPVVVEAETPVDKDLAAVQAYRLSESGLAKYTAAVRNLGKLEEREAIVGEDDEDEGAQSIDAQVARYDAIPEIKQAIVSAGMTTREYTLFTWSMFEAGMASWVLTQPGGKLPPGVSMDNVTFYRKHEAELKSLKEVLDPADASSDDDGDEADDQE